MLLRQMLPAFTAGSVAKQLGACSRSSLASAGYIISCCNTECVLYLLLLSGLCVLPHQQTSLCEALRGGMMAGAEVTVSSGQLVTMKEEEGEYSGKNNKNQVILHLHGLNYDTAETGTTVLAIETHQEDSKAKGDEIEYGYPITCGDSRAVLLFKKFVCPGINVRCIKFNDQLISPKQFVHLAGKATLKDWKRAIRLGGVMLRKMMDSGQIDFYQHDSVCSNTCRSTKFDVLINSTRPPPGTAVQPSLSSLALDPVGGQVPPLTGAAHNLAEVEEPLEDKFGATAEWGNGQPRLVNPTTANGHSAKRKRAKTTDGVLSLWRDVADSGLMGEVLSSLQTEILTSLKGVERRSEKANLLDTDALILNSLSEMFGLLDSVKQALDLRRSQNEESRIVNNVHGLDDIVEDQRKQSCNRSRSSKNSSLKHVRPHPRTQNLLSSIRRSTVIHPLSVTGLSTASYPQLFTHTSAFSRKCQRAGASRTYRGDSQRDQEIGEAGNQEKALQLGRESSEKEDASGMHSETGWRRVKLLGESHIRCKVKEETQELYGTENIIMGRKTSKK
ncbi:glucocorticoid modulatory element-binding protein 1-like isoform 2-T2 [Odontesthes bonariensis]|uniref:glucocorticoid modulatory element-binding protein 1-like isoform X2 n=1 Tax=Odontesthes bonariensis TaxID=219752 RepID=UPI003F584D97